MREYIAETTRRGGFPPFLINTGIALAPRRPEASSSPLEYTPFAQKAPEATVKSPPKDEAGPSAPGGRKASRKTTRKADGSSPDGLPNSPSGPPTDTGSQPGSEAGSGSNNDSESPSNSQTLSPNAAFKWTH
jgi:hypothetical protein